MEPRLVFELEYLASLEDYKKVKLNVAYTYRDTVAGSIWKEKSPTDLIEIGQLT